MYNSTATKIVVMYGPSASGRTTLLKKLFNDYPNTFGFSIRHTTRKPRQNEINGFHYHFITYPKMLQLIKNGNFVEHVNYCGNLYGTSKDALQTVTQQGKVCVLDICIFGVQELKKIDFDCWYVFVTPPNLDELRRRLRQRNTERGQDFVNRLNMAEKEIFYGTNTNNSDLILINKDLEETYSRLVKFFEDKVLGAKLVK